MKGDEYDLPGSSCYVVSWSGVSGCRLSTGARRLLLTRETLGQAAKLRRGLSIRSQNALLEVIDSGDVAWWEDLTERRLYAVRNCGFTSVNEILKFVQDGRHWILNE